MNNPQMQIKLLRASKKVGFTLVELSIVLVVIGLLIGGILVGQSLVESAKINAVVKEFQQYQIGFSQFKLKYRYLPGDHPNGSTFSSLCTNSSCNGTGDGKINTQITANNLEVRNVWYHMQALGNLNLKLPFSTTANQVITSWISGDNFPKSVYGESNMVLFGTISNSNGIGLGISNSNIQKLGIQISASGKNWFDGIIKPSDALAIDKKKMTESIIAAHSLEAIPIQCILLNAIAFLATDII